MTSSALYKATPPTLGDGDRTSHLCDASGNLKVSSGGSGTTADQVQGNVAHDAADSGNPAKIGGYASGNPPTAVAAGDRVNAWYTVNGAAVIAAGMQISPNDGFANNAFMGYRSHDGGAGYAILAGGLTYNGTTWDRVKKPNSTSRIVSAAATTNATVAKASAGDLFTVTGYNAAAAVRYLKFYNKATAPTVGTDTPVLTIPLAPTAAFNINLQSHYFSTGISYALTTGAADADTGDLTAADIVGLNITYQ